MKTLAFFGVVLVVDLLAVIFQAYSPSLPMFQGAVVLVFPVFLAYAALALPFPGALAVAFCNGLLWDALTVQFIRPGTYGQGPLMEEISLGWSVVLFGVLAILVHGLRPLFLRGRWDLHCLASGFCTVVILAAQYLMITFRLGGLIFPKTLWMRMLLPGFFAMLLSVPVYFAFYFVAEALEYPVWVEEDEHERRRRQRQQSA